MRSPGSCTTVSNVSRTSCWNSTKSKSERETLHPQLPTRILADTQVNIPLFFWVGFIPSQVGRGDLALLLVRFPAGSLVLGKRRTSSSTSRGRRSQPSLPRGGIPRAPVACRTQNLRCDFMILRHNGCVCLINCRQRATLFVSFFLTSIFLLMGFFPIFIFFAWRFEL